MLLEYIFIFNGEETEADSVVFGDQTGTFGLKRNDTNEVLIPINTFIDHVAGTSRYTKEFFPPVVGSYTWALKITYLGNTSYWQNIFAHEEATIQNRSYSSLDSASIYFATRYYSDAWTNASADDKQKTLNVARELIDRLNFIGSRTLINQDFEWPRTGLIDYDSSLVPEEILIAERLISLSLLQGYDPEMEIRQQRILSRGFQSVRTTYDPSFVLDHVGAGIPSALAWAYLRPFLSNASGIRLHRVS